MVWNVKYSSVLAAAVFGLIGNNLWAACPTEDIIAGEYIVRALATSDSPQKSSKLEETFSFKEFLEFNSYTSSKIHSAIKNKQEQKIGQKAGIQYADIFQVKADTSNLSALINHPDVLSVEPNCKVYSLEAPNDEFYPQQLAMQQIAIPLAWQYSLGSKNIVVAVSDTGVDYTHPDLALQMWENLAEKNGVPGVDDDGNGCVDDIYGCDLADEDGDPRPGLLPGSHHGTHVAGIIGAQTNNSIGISGVLWKTQIMAVKGFPDSSQTSNLATLLKTIYYAADNGADVINCSWGTFGSPGQAERDAIAYAKSKNSIVVVAAGNSASSAEQFSPAGIADVITVGSVNSQNQLSSFSNFGPSIDLLAPGGDSPSFGGLDEKIYSTLPDGNFGGERGTSMAAPFVTATIALMLSYKPNLTEIEIVNLLKNSAIQLNLQVPRDDSISHMYSILNSGRVMQNLAGPDANTCPTQFNCSFSTDLPSTNSMLPLAAEMGGCGITSAASNEANRGMASLFLFFCTLPIWIIAIRR